jgi:putative transposase
MPVAATTASVVEATTSPTRREKMKGAMSNLSGVARCHERWARFRFSVIGPLLAAPPERGELQEQLKSLAARKWYHPITGQRVQFGLSTIERWFYTARNEKKDPVQALRRKIRSDQGGHPALSSKVRELLATQYRQHPNWSYQLHTDNLVVLIEKEPTLGLPPSYTSVLRFMRDHGLIKRSRRGPVYSPGAQVTEHRVETREIRSYESEYVNALWHLDFHHGSLRVLINKGRWIYPLMLGIIDDHSRLCCHAQWYLAEGVEELCHGLSQALQKRALPRALMSDNGSAMLAAETTEGLARLGIVHEKTLPYAPFQNGKQESFWNGIEGRLLPMLEGVVELTLAGLNEATLAWIEMEYNRSVHSELGEAPLQRYLHHRDVGRPCPSSAELKIAFTAEAGRTQRRSDGTISLKGIRFEIPSRYHHFQRLSVRAACWDLSLVHLADPKTGAILCRLFPLDKQKNAQGERAAKGSPVDKPAGAVSPAPSSVAPLLQKLIQQYAITGLPPAYLPKQQSNTAHE